MGSQKIFIPSCQRYSSCLHDRDFLICLFLLLWALVLWRRFSMGIMTYDPPITPPFSQTIQLFVCLGLCSPFLFKFMNILYQNDPLTLIMRSCVQQNWVCTSEHFLLPLGESASNDEAAILKVVLRALSIAIFWKVSLSPTESFPFWLCSFCML